MHTQKQNIFDGSARVRVAATAVEELLVVGAGIMVGSGRLGHFLVNQN